jgi:putative SOS response-associated peptidase YedK
MCGRYTNPAGVEGLNEHFGVPLKDDAGTKRFNIAPTEEVLALVAPREQVVPRLPSWGLLE